MLISALSDLDPLGDDIEPFFEVARESKEPQLLLLAGDMYDYRMPKRYAELVIFFRKEMRWKCPIVAVPGNHEFDEDLPKVIKSIGKEMIFLNDEKVILNIGGKKVGIVGSRGALDEPTMWQMHNVVSVKDIYKLKISIIKKLLMGMKADIKILLTHYAPTYMTMEGEDISIFPGLGTRKLEPVMKETGVTFAVHGHAHYGLPFAKASGTPVYNVAFLVNNRIVEIDTNKL